MDACHIQGSIWVAQSATHGNIQGSSVIINYCYFPASLCNFRKFTPWTKSGIIIRLYHIFTPDLILLYFTTAVVIIAP